MFGVPPVWYLALLSLPLAMGIGYWISNRPEGDAGLEPGESELDFEAPEGLTVRLSTEYLCSFLYELREKFEAGWSLSQVAAVLHNVVDRQRPRWQVSYVVTAAGTVGEIHLQFARTDCASVLCGVEFPPQFAGLLRRHLKRYPFQQV